MKPFNHIEKITHSGWYVIKANQSKLISLFLGYFIFQPVTIIYLSIYVSIYLSISDRGCRYSVNLVLFQCCLNRYLILLLVLALPLNEQINALTHAISSANTHTHTHTRIYIYIYFVIVFRKEMSSNFCVIKHFIKISGRSKQTTNTRMYSFKCISLVTLLTCRHYMYYGV